MTTRIFRAWLRLRRCLSAYTASMISVFSKRENVCGYQGELVAGLPCDQLVTKLPIRHVPEARKNPAICGVIPRALCRI